MNALQDEPHAELFEVGRPRAVRLRLDAGESVPEHTHPDADVFFYVLEGRLALSLEDESYDLSAGEAVRFSGERAVRPEAVTDATALVTFAPRPD